MLARLRALAPPRVVALVSVCVLMLASACGTGASASARNPLSGIGSYVSIPGAPLGPARQAVTLTTGKTWAFDQVQPGTITVLYFGYTSCPDVCPLTMADVARALSGVPAAVRSRVRVVFVSTDPHRDTLTQLRGWLGGFSPSFVGGRAPIETVIAAARTYGISIEPPRVTHGDYQVAHGAEVLVLRPGGGMVGYFRAKARWRDYATALPTLVKRYATGS